ncbi:hypothetical protein [Mesobacillus jeotgali]|uniref:Uncharacterized protein n=1 Tax=Mesobacillus jeotgali TaxID=129985 RepID=A0ABY9VDD3_9BACI|nr:hypothetical protein [Mesobacillus jeotgali]WNF21911.1 hypothetical protein RH061_17205 [Mesobacillus jeotgali]
MIVKGEKLSEVRATLDRFGVERGKAVRRKGNFGQVWCRKRKSCQNKSQLRTGMIVKGEKLSEVRATLDRFGVERGKAVRTRANFEQVW